MRKITEKMLSEFKVGDEGYKIYPEGDYTGYKVCPKGDYSNIKVFKESCIFADSSIFSPYTKFRKQCIFGNYNTLGVCCTVAENSTFGCECVLGPGSVFGDFCTIGKDSSIGEQCVFGDHCFIRDIGGVGTLCHFGNFCIINKQILIGNSILTLSMGRHTIIGIPTIKYDNGVFIVYKKHSKTVFSKFSNDIKEPDKTDNLKMAIKIFNNYYSILVGIELDKET